MTDTLIDVLRRAAQTTDRGFVFLNDALEPRSWTFEQVFQETERRGRYFRSLGLNPGDRLAMIIPDGEDFVLSFLGAIRAGIIPVPMYPPLALAKLDRYIETTAKIMGTAGAKMLLTSKSASNILWSLIQRVPSLEAIQTTEDVAGHNSSQIKATLDDVRVKADDPCFLQFTSGSTSDPKGVVVTHANLIANSKAIVVDGLNSDPKTDRGVSWLPLYHDMGLIGFVIAPLLTTIPVVFIPTLSFVKRPNVWMDTISKYKGTITFAPNFAFGLAAKRITPRRLEKLDLSGLRVVGCGAEPINRATMQTFVEAFKPAKLSPEAIMPAYGMAEATLAISFDDTETPFKTLTIDRAAYELEGIVAEPTSSAEQDRLELVACGRTFPEHKVGVMGESGQLLGDNAVGEIVFSGPSVAARYYENPEATEKAFSGGWLHTGDLGFLRDGTVFVSGRRKDLIILNGRNYYPQSIEWEVEQIEGIRLGNVVAFSTKGESSEQLVVAAETKVTNPEKKELLQQSVEQRIYEQLGVRTHEVKLIPPGSLPKTSSGKVQRARTKYLFDNGQLGHKDNRSFGATARLVIAKHVVASTYARISHHALRPAKTVRRWIQGFRSPMHPRG